MKIRAILMLITVFISQQPALGMQAPSLDDQLRQEFQSPNINAAKVRRILQAGASPYILSAGRPLLDIAILNSSIRANRESLMEVIQLLLEHGASPTENTFKIVDAHEQKDPAGSAYFQAVREMLYENIDQMFSQPAPQPKQPVQQSTPGRGEKFKTQTERTPVVAPTRPVANQRPDHR